MKREFRVAVTTDKQTGRLMAVYFQVRRGKAAEVREFEQGNALANYNANGELLGIELLGPCKLKVVDQIAEKDGVVRQFIRSNAPRKMLVGSSR
ncbi:MAG: hypothetical protein HYS13_22535 [Planctomycetia bacterium]|nr:hypothetical protein [Planctomycetia bacterium]